MGALPTPVDITPAAPNRAAFMAFGAPLISRSADEKMFAPTRAEPDVDLAIG